MSYRYVTIIIPVHNSEKTLPYVLNSIKLLNYPHKYIKIVIVYDCSEDRTLQKAMSFKYENEAEFHSIEVVRLDREATTSEARNEGIKRAVPGSYLLFLDSDVIPKPDTLDRLMEIAESSPGVGAVGALYLTSNPSLFEILMGYRSLGKVSEGPAGTGALLVKWEVFEKVGFFNERLGYLKTIYEDLEYVMRIRRGGYKVLIDGREPLLHFKPAPSEEVLIRGSRSKSSMRLLKHLVSYFSLRKAFALHEVLKVAP
jgi:GT2 family glycosyltransferase